MHLFLCAILIVFKFMLLLPIHNCNTQLKSQLIIPDYTHRYYFYTDSSFFVFSVFPFWLYHLCDSRTLYIILFEQIWPLQSHKSKEFIVLIRTIWSFQVMSETRFLSFYICASYRQNCMVTFQTIAIWLRWYFYCETLGN